MKRLILAIIIAVLLPSSAYAVTILSEEAEKSISERCVDAQQSMQILQRSDAVTRINRGNSYATIQKLMTAMSARSAAHAYDVPALTESTRSFTELKDQFVSEYTEYEISLRSLIIMDCQDQPVAFYDRLEGVRDRRAVLEQIVKDMDKQMKDFEEAVKELQIRVKERADA